MPNRELEAFRVNSLGPMADRRRKLTPEQRLEIKELHDAGQSIRSLARDFMVSRKTIQLIVHPDLAERNRRALEARGGWRIYYSPERKVQHMRSHRAYKRELLTKTKGE